MTLEDVPPEEQTSFYESIGRAITAWSGVEIQLAMLFGYLATGDRVDQGAMAAFHAVDAFRPRLEMILSMLKLRTYNEGVHSTWDGIAARVVKRQRKRSHLAHWNIMSKPDGEPGRRACLVPTFMDPIARREYMQGKQHGMFEKDILAAEQEFVEAREQVRKFILDLEKFSKTQ